MAIRLTPSQIKEAKGKLTVEGLLEVLVEYQNRQDVFTRDILKEISGLLEKTQQLTEQVAKKSPEVEVEVNLDAIKGSVEGIVDKLQSPNIEIKMDGLLGQLSNFSTENIESEIKQLSEVIRQKMDEKWEVEMKIKRDRMGRTESIYARNL